MRRSSQGALLFLNSGAASHVTGQVLWIDEGYTAGVSTGQFPSTR
jgi:enoyl-[acyl-carrier-protein] reductase (NADH)